jgi:hypothetical protein
MPVQTGSVQPRFERSDVAKPLQPGGVSTEVIAAAARNRQERMSLNARHVVTATILREP